MNRLMCSIENTKKVPKLLKIISAVFALLVLLFILNNIQCGTICALGKRHAFGACGIVSAKNFQGLKPLFIREEGVRSPCRRMTSAAEEACGLKHMSEVHHVHAARRQ